MKWWVCGYSLCGYSVVCEHRGGTVGILGIKRFGTFYVGLHISLIPLLYDQNVGLLQVLKLIVMGRATLKQFAGK